MKNLIEFASVCFVAALGFSAFAEASVSDVTVRQQWPWSKDIVVGYTLDGMEDGAVDLTVSATNGAESFDAAKLSAAISGERFGVIGNGRHELMIDPVKALGTVAGDVFSEFRVKIAISASAANINDELYRIYDLADGTFESLSRADIMNHPEKYGPYETDFSKIGPGFNTTLPAEEVFIWTGVTNNPAYKTDKIVMRRVSAAGKVWASGASDNKRYVKLMQDYLIAVFETTQPQWTKNYGTNYSIKRDAEDADFRPAEGMKSGEIIGFRAEWPQERSGQLGYHRCLVHDEIWNWPNNTYLRDVDKKSFMKLLWDKTGYEFYLPTQAQWEYACRAGTTTDYNSGKDQTEANAKEVAWIEKNTTEAHPVGQKPCNAFGLYDMHGNVAETCLGAGSISSGHDGVGLTEDDPIVDPLGTAGTAEIKRGGAYTGPSGFNGWQNTKSYSTSSWYNYNTGDRADMGFRLVCPVERQWASHE